MGEDMNPYQCQFVYYIGPLYDQWEKTNGYRMREFELSWVVHDAPHQNYKINAWDYIGEAQTCHGIDQALHGNNNDDRQPLYVNLNDLKKDN